MFTCTELKFTPHTLQHIPSVRKCTIFHTNCKKLNPHSILKLYQLLALCGHTLPHVPQKPILNLQPIVLPWRPEIFPLVKCYTEKVFFRKVSSDARKFIHKFSSHLQVLEGFKTKENLYAGITVLAQRFSFNLAKGRNTEDTGSTSVQRILKFFYCIVH